ncbi:family 43 glycosylhydrolase [Flavivirga algicola]|uniref:Family 43 glycosylhydrolase n=1 Tax=Flavivirga algicola TaxID=2729136 RepID=A0ABX1RRX6_9FLAO|nr:family 43 glycosylhydrolase [Flavivirga algicola]NMH86306.1 family 43 glycosylhydrolase [Flavivirga algicola]
MSTILFLTVLTVYAQTRSRIYDQYVQEPKKSPLIDFSKAGYAYGEQDFQYPGSIIDVTSKDIYPNTGEDLTKKVQALIDETGKNGGGVLYFPKGKYTFNTNPNNVDFLKIDYDNIVIRGEGQGEEGTIFYNSTSLLNKEPNPWLSPTLIRYGYKIQGVDHFWGAAPLKYNGAKISKKSEQKIYEAPKLTSVTHKAVKGSKNLRVKNTTALKAGDVVLLAMYNTNGSNKLIKKVLNYTDVELTPDLESANRAEKEGVASFQALVEIERIISGDQILLRQPLLMDIDMEFQPMLLSAPMVRNVGIENLRFASAWDGNYKHHANRDVDYGWNAVNFCRVAHGWMKNVTIDNYTNPIYLQDSKNVTLDSIFITGKHGHSGIKVYAHASDNLIQNVNIQMNFSHVLSGEGNATRNVFRKITMDKQMESEGDFDFHGFAHYTYGPASHNLFEEITGLRFIYGGGAPRNFPHTSINNVWWNIESTDVKGTKELFKHWPWNKTDRIDHHISYPSSIIAGVSANDGKFIINGSESNRSETLITVESLNGKISPKSLYEAQKKANSGFKNPIIPGFYPDPSVCRVGEDYYLATSTFEYFPGVPIFHSRDLINWKKIGHALTRKSQVDLEGCKASGGIYAPTLRYHDGLFYMVTTNVTGDGNFLVYTDNPSGEWSEPVWLEIKGYDPSLYWEDGKCHVTTSNGSALIMAEIDLKTGKNLSEVRNVWEGTGGRFPEAPHIYKKDGFYYMIVAEGGTQYGHKVTIARSKNLYGPYTSNPANPILTHADEPTKRNPIQGTGHADFVQAHDGSWWAVILGFRPVVYRHHVMGRETCLAPVSWEKNTWPVINGTGSIAIDMKTPTLPLKPFLKKTTKDDLDGPLDLDWNFIRNPEEANYSLSARKGYLRLKGTKVKLDDIGSPTFIGQRQTNSESSITILLELDGSKKDISTGLSVFMNNLHHYDVMIKRSKGQQKLVLRSKLGNLDFNVSEIDFAQNKVYLKVETTARYYKFSYSTDGNNYKMLGELDTRYLSSETAGGFTGVYIGLFAESNKGAYVDFDWIEKK